MRAAAAAATWAGQGHEAEWGVAAPGGLAALVAVAAAAAAEGAGFLVEMVAEARGRVATGKVAAEMAVEGMVAAAMAKVAEARAAGVKAVVLLPAGATGAVAVTAAAGRRTS